jgi:hypothetical protein
MDPLAPIRDRLMTDCHELAGSERPQPRPVGNANHLRARRYLAGRLRDLGLAPAFGTDWILPYADRFANIVARLPGHKSRAAHATTILLGAHYDTCGETPGADDNAAAAAIVLEAIKHLSNRPIARDVVGAFFDAEEPPYFLSEAMGSTRLLVDVLLPANENVLPIVLDLCGHDVPLHGLEPALFVVGLETSAQARAAFERTAAPENLLPLPIPNIALGGDFSDYHAFNARGFPYVFLTCGEWEHYHAPTDTVDRLSQSKMARVALYLEAFVRNLHDELERDDGLPGAKQSSAEPSDVLHTRSNATDRARFYEFSEWFHDRLGPPLAHAGIPMSGDLESDLRRLRQSLA